MVKLENLKNQKGSITLYVLVALLFIIIGLMGTYAITSNKQIADLEVAKQIKEVYEKDINNVNKIYNSLVSKKTETEKPEEIWNIDKGVNSPQLIRDMKPVYWNTDGTEKKQGEPGFDINNWYDYTIQTGSTVNGGTSKWANAITKDGSYWVWIPRYAYKIISGFHSDTAGEIDIVFIDKENKNANIMYNTTYPTTSGDKMNDYVVHPAFSWGKEALAGIWVAKYEASRADATDTTIGSSDVIKSVANTQGFRGITADEIFTKCKGMNNTNNVYGFTATEYPHMMKNSEWGVVAYLAHSKYGRNRTEIDVNSIYNKSGQGAVTGKEELASTTGNKYGIYDLSGGGFEYVAAYLSNGNVGKYESLRTETDARYKDVYEAYNISKYGDAIYETSSGESGFVSWNKDAAFFPINVIPVFIRGGNFDSRSNAGIFYYDYYDGNGFSERMERNYTFRPVFVIGNVV